MGEEKTELILPSRFEAIETAVAAAADFAAKCGIAEDAMFGVELAMREALANAIKHGNREDKTKMVRVSFEKLPGEMVVTITDEGAGFDFENLPDPTDPANLLKESGRGIFLIRNFMDAAEWQQAGTGGTTLEMRKKF